MILFIAGFCTGVITISILSLLFLRYQAAKYARTMKNAKEAEKKMKEVMGGL